MDDLEETRQTYDRVAETYERRHADRSAVAHLLADFVAAVPDDGTVVDVGCGPGWEAESLAAEGYDVAALDLTESFCHRAAERVPGRVLRADMRRLPVGTDAVDGIWACASFLHVPRDDADGVLAGFADALRPGGWLCLSVKAGAGTRRGDAYDGDDRRFTLYRRAELETRLERAGFDVESVDRSDGWLGVVAELSE